MNDSELNNLLKSVPMPPRPESYWKDFPGRVATLLPRPSKIRRPAAWRLPRLSWSYGFALACLIFGFGVGLWQGRSHPDQMTGLEDKKVVREVMALFPNRVQAIIQDEKGIHLVLSDQPNVPASTPIWVRACSSHGNCFTAVTFSGQQLQFDGQPVEILAGRNGNVMVVGTRMFWTSEEPDRAAEHWRIRARTLNDTL